MLLSSTTCNILMMVNSTVSRDRVRPAQLIVLDSRQYPSQLQSALQAVGRDGFDIVLDAVAGEFLQPSYS